MIFSAIKSKYSISSSYVQGSKEVSCSLKEAIEDYQRTISQSDIQEMIKELEILLELIKIFYLTKDHDHTIIKYIFNRRTIILKYLLSKSEVRKVFKL